MSLALILAVLMTLALLYRMDYGEGFQSSFFEAGYFKGQRVMIIVPHQDDELCLAGPMIKGLTDMSAQTYVVFTTNGDYAGIGEKRLKESIRALALLGVEEDHILFMGYGDQWSRGHIYHEAPENILASYAGRTATYGLAQHSDFRTKASGFPSPYTIDAYLKDMKDILMMYLPDIILAIDFDDHPDHRAASLIFERALGELLSKKGGDYHPMVYKGYAYATAWKAENDFYALNLPSTKLPQEEKLNHPDYELDTPAYNFSDRVRFPVPYEMLSYTHRSNLLYRALCAYESQNARYYASNIINGDNIFFSRRTDSLSYQSEVFTSSGEGCYLKDFKLMDSRDITDKNALLSDCVWSPGSLNSWARLVFEKETKVTGVSLYDNMSLEDNILSGRLRFSDGSEIIVPALNRSGQETWITFPLIETNYVEFVIDEAEGDAFGLTELEVFGEVQRDETAFIKLTSIEHEDMFIYRYIGKMEEEIRLGVYQYPNRADYNITLIEDAEGKASLRGDALLLQPALLPYRCVVRAALVSDPSVYDQVEVFADNGLMGAFIKWIQFLEKVLNKIMKVGRGLVLNP